MRTVFGIRNTAGVLIAEHVRVDLPTGKKTMHWQLPNCDPRDGLGGLSTSDLPLFGSECLGMYPAGSTVVITEGERATEALWRLGFPAAGTVTGASSTPGEDALSPLLPFDVVLWPDFDEPGYDHMKRVAASMIRLGGSVRRVTWGEHTGDDAADFIERGTSRTILAELVKHAPPWVVEPPAPKQPPQPRYERCSADDNRRDAARSHLLQVVEQKLGHGKKSGQSIWWCCPFHAERTPSFKVDLREPYYRCHGCGARGDVFTFLRAIEGVLFKDALQELAPALALGGIRGFAT